MKSRILHVAAAVAFLAPAFAAQARGEPFLLGQQLAGQVGGSLQMIQAAFEIAEAGKARFELVAASPTLAATFTVRTAGGLVLKSWSVKPGKRFAKKVRFTQAGAHVLVVQSASATAACFVLATATTLGDPAKSVVDTAAGDQVAIAFLAVKGERFAVDFLPFNWDIGDHFGVLGPEIRRPDGSLSWDYTVEGSYGNSIVDAGADQTGVWTVTWKNLNSPTDQVLLRVRKQNAAQTFIY